MEESSVCASFAEGLEEQEGEGRGEEEEEEEEIEQGVSMFHTVGRTHSKGISLLPADRDPPRGLPLLQRLRHHEDDEHEVENSDHGGQQNHLQLPVLAGQVDDVGTQGWADDEACCKGGRHLGEEVQETPSVETSPPWKSLALNNGIGHCTSLVSSPDDPTSPP